MALQKLPEVQPTLRVIPMGYDTNPRGDIFGGWVMSQIDIAGSIAAFKTAKGPIATIAVKELVFESPLFVGDIVSLYTNVLKVGTKSVTVQVEVYAERQEGVVKAANAVLVYVAVSKPGQSRVISQ
jgi:acyl-CoA thioesterase YciA